MRAIPKPLEPAEDVYSLCVNSIEDDDLRSRLTSIKSSILEAANEYEKKAQTSTLCCIDSDESKNEKVIIGKVKKQELLNLYTYHLVPKKKKARSIYDKLLISAPSGRCPTCGFGQADTLDHYLPKAKFPLFSVLPLNLVPACSVCNKGKLTEYATIVGQQSLHPYFDQGAFISDQWIYASLEESLPVTIKYLVKTPDSWDKVSKQRAMSHFICFNLSKRFSAEASNELTSLSSMLNTYFKYADLEEIRIYLNRIADIEFNLHKNSWKTAMYQTLASSDWYCEVGYKLQ